MNFYLVLTIFLSALFNKNDLGAITKYYATMPMTSKQVPAAGFARGEQLYKLGDYSQGISACITCHGPKGTGSAQSGFPNLNGQHARYMQKQLQDFKENKRSNDLSHVMQTIAGKLSAQDMEAVSQYIESLH